MRWRRSRAAGGRRSSRNVEPMATFDIRIIGDPVLKQVTRPITDIDGKLAQLATDMLDTMYAVPGIGLAAP